MDSDSIGNILYIIVIVFFLLLRLITGNKKKNIDKGKEPGKPPSPGKTLEEIFRELTGDSPRQKEPVKPEVEKAPTPPPVQIPERKTVQTPQKKTYTTPASQPPV